MALTEVQNKVLNIYKQVREVCQKHDIQFYALGGTLLGAVRHKGFIPWDDDFDIAIPRPDYDRFLQIAKNELPDSLQTSTYIDEYGDGPISFFCTVKDTNTLVELNYASKVRRTSIWLDVFPLDAMPSNSLQRMVHKYRLLYERMKIQFSMYEENAHQHRENRPLYERMLMRFREVTKFGSDWDTHDLMRHIETILRKYDYEKEDYVVNMFGAYKFNEMFPKNWLGEGIELPFEDTSIPCGMEFDKILTQMYGDYMTLPPEDKRSLQHCMTVVSLGSEQEAV